MLYRCCSCYTVVFIKADELSGPNFSREEDGRLYVNSCRVCEHWRYYEPILPPAMPFP